MEEGTPITVKKNKTRSTLNIFGTHTPDLRPKGKQTVITSSPEYAYWFDVIEFKFKFELKPMKFVWNVFIHDVFFPSGARKVSTRIRYKKRSIRFRYKLFSSRTVKKIYIRMKSKFNPIFLQIPLQWISSTRVPMKMKSDVIITCTQYKKRNRTTVRIK